MPGRLFSFAIMDEVLAIRLLRLILGAWNNQRSIDVPIPISSKDFCCASHAVVASLVLAAFGVKTRIARGRASLFTKTAIMPILNHYFVVRSSDDAVFDSSVEFPVAEFNNEEVKFVGVGFNGCPDLPLLQVLHQRKNLGRGEMERIQNQAQDRPIITYIEDSAQAPE